MMVTEPDHWIEDMADAGVDRYVFHVEPVPGRIGSICRRVREAGMKVGLALNPDTNVSVIEKYIALADLVLIMTVDFTDHTFLTDQMKKVQWLRGRYPSLDIQVDGSVKLDNVDLCAQVFIFYQFSLIYNGYCDVFLYFSQEQMLLFRDQLFAV